MYYAQLLFIPAESVDQHMCMYNIICKIISGWAHKQRNEDKI